jgi:uncharacterized protein
VSDEPAPARRPEIADRADGEWDTPWTWVDAALAFLAGLLAGEVLRQFFSVLLAPATYTAAEPILGGLGFVVGIVGWLRLRHPGSLRKLVGPRQLRVAVVVAGLGHGIVAFVVLNLGAATLFSFAAEAFRVDLPPVQESLRRTIADPDLAVGGLVYALSIAVLAEELFFRGLLFPVVRRPLGRWPAIGITGVFFGLAHYQPDPLAWSYTFTVMFAFGMYLAWAYDRYGHLLVVLLMHALFNALAVVALLRAWG